ncbi:MAG: Bax inhibitor-1/YccA family protein [Hyphomicrobiales bacterium]|nr:Bax inhibitor-1/YccA family protein [Hyphomicrobiales bacterium]
MANYDNQQARDGTRAGSVPAVDEGLRDYMLRVYNYMGIGLAITGLAAIVMSSLAVSSTPTEYALQNGVYLTSFGAAVYGSFLSFIIMLAPLGVVFFLSYRVNKMSVSAAQTTFWVFSLLMGLSLSSIFLVYTATSITQVFFISAAMFGAMSIWGYTTKRDLTAMGSFLMMGVIGLLVAMVVNIFLGSDALGFAISVIGVGVFVGLTAYDTQKIKEMYYVNDDASVAGRKAVMGALTLYLDLILIFQFMLALFGNRN